MIADVHYAEVVEFCICVGLFAMEGEGGKKLEDLLFLGVLFLVIDHVHIIDDDMEWVISVWIK